MLNSLGQGSVLQGRERVSNALRNFEKNKLSVVQQILPNDPIPSDFAEDFRLGSTPPACLDPVSLAHGGQSVSTGAYRVSSTFPFAATGHIVTLAVEHLELSGAECVDHWLTALSTPRVVYQSACRDWGANNPLLFFHIEIQNASNSKTHVNLGDLKVIDGEGGAHEAINARLYAAYPKRFIPSTIDLKPGTSASGWVAFRAKGSIATAVAYETEDRALIIVLLQGPQRAT